MVAGQEECRLPEPGHYANSDGEEVPCTPIIDLQAEWLPTPEEGLAEDKCPFTCEKYHAKKDDGEVRTCKVPAEKHYADNQGQSKVCTNIDFSDSIGGQAVAVASPGKCPFTCLSGYVQDKTARTCSPPSKGQYANAEGVAASCSDIVGSAGGFEDFVENTGSSAVPVSSPTGCDFTCNGGFIKNKARRACNTPGPGKYANTQGRESSCTGSIANSDTIGGQGEPVSNGAQCPFTCLSGFVKKTSNRTCNIPDTGKYANAQGGRGQLRSHYRGYRGL